MGAKLAAAAHPADDRGMQWDLILDSPAAIAVAAKQSVRRWRLAQLSRTLPALVPRYCDIGAPECPEGTIVVDFAATLGQLLNCKLAHRDVPFWTPKWRGDLASAVSGGQWPQTRRAAVPAWGIEDLNCQLCHQQPGTLLHRWCCDATRPLEGWPVAPSRVMLVTDRIRQDRRQLLQTRAMLALRLPQPPKRLSEWFTWHLSPPETIGDSTWYLDGSMLDGDWPDYRAVGFAIVVVSSSGNLLAYGNGCPPNWCCTAAAAETWALFVALSCCPFPPSIRTDCLALLHAAEGGLARATSAQRPSLAFGRKLAVLWMVT